MKIGIPKRLTKSTWTSLLSYKSGFLNEINMMVSKVNTLEDPTQGKTERYNKLCISSVFESN